MTTELPADVVAKMLEIAKEDLFNPLYEQVVREFEEAKIRMEHATNKLAQAVKLTDNDKLNERLNPVLDIDSVELKMFMQMCAQQMAEKNAKSSYK